MNKFVLPAFLVAASLCAGRANAQCEGDGPVLTVPSVVALGDVVTAYLHADSPASVAAFFASSGDGPTNLASYGIACLDFPVDFAAFLALDPNGDAQLDGEIPCDPGLIGVTFYVQFISCGGKFSHHISNMVAITITDGIHDGDLCTYTQAGYNLECSKGGAGGCVLADHFADVFPNGVLIGDKDGDDADDCYASLWDTIGSIENFLTQDVGCALLVGDRKRPTKESGFKFGAELLVAKLNVGFDDAGVFDEGKCRPDLKLGDLVFTGCVDEDLIGWSVRDLIHLSDLVICGDLGSGPYDIDGDDHGDVNCDDLMDALEVLNKNFENCEVNVGCLGLPN